MKKAIQVTNQLEVEELNKLFEQGYEIESVDDNGIYILKCDELKAEPIKTIVNLDTERAQRSFDLLADTIKQIKDGKHKANQPHVRIEFEDIRDVPKVWIDGELIEELINLKVLWNTNTQTENYKEFDVYYYDLTGERPMRRGFREGTPR